MEQEVRWIKEIQKKRSLEAADRLVSLYYNEIYAYCYRQTGNKETSMDLTQEIFISTLQSIDRFDRRRGVFRCWLYRIATNKIIDTRRRRGAKNIPLEEIEIEDSQEDFVLKVEQKGLIQKIEWYVSGLDFETQQIFRLHLYGGYSFPQIAGFLEKEEATVKSRYYRLLKMLRKEFEYEYSISER